MRRSSLYCLRDWITIRDGDTNECPSHVPADDPANVPARPELNQRQKWVLEQLERGVALSRVSVEEQFGVGEKTAKRDLSDLVRAGLIEFLRCGRTGTYRRVRFSPAVDMPYIT